MLPKEGGGVCGGEGGGLSVMVVVLVVFGQIFCLDGHCADDGTR